MSYPLGKEANRVADITTNSICQSTCWLMITGPLLIPRLILCSQYFVVKGLDQLKTIKITP